MCVCCVYFILFLSYLVEKLKNKRPFKCNHGDETAFDPKEAAVVLRVSRAGRFRNEQTDKFTFESKELSCLVFAPLKLKSKADLNGTFLQYLKSPGTNLQTDTGPSLL